MEMDYSYGTEIRTHWSKVFDALLLKPPSWARPEVQAFSISNIQPMRGR
ncbi:hypothetical protein SLEP1_g42659 [Rubroshorea leprosula]|uniref:Uncharacterized protein n=1 Tax=Rubroshorea leprosula TaxID=152421 RepID=A0AAV5LAK9_9ROSI|nr:hypothetical protein SLEP1_g42659 [Rubroshorea leprosula]